MFQKGLQPAPLGVTLTLEKIDVCLLLLALPRPSLHPQSESPFSGLFRHGFLTLSVTGELSAFEEAQRIMECPFLRLQKNSIS
jgi:hypothetical protein